MPRLVSALTSLIALSALLAPGLRPAMASSPHKSFSPTKPAKVRYIFKGLSVQPPHGSKHAGHVNDLLYNSYSLETLQNQKASIGFPDGTVLHMNADTDVTLTTHLTRLAHGEIAEYLQPGTNHRIQTSAATAAATGTTFDIRSDGTTSVFVVLHGALQVGNGSGAVLVTSNHETIVKPGKAPAPPFPVNAEAVFAWTAGIPTPDLAEDVSLDANGGQIINFSSQRAGPGTTGHIENINDGRLDTGWESAEGKTTNQTVTFGFQGGNFYRISEVIIDPAAPNGDPASEDVKDFEIRVSSSGTDDASFTTVFRGTCVQKATLQIFTFAVPVRAKYVQLVALDNYGSPDRLAVTEMEVVANTSLFAQPGGVAVDGKGNLYVSDTNSDRIVKLSPKGKVVAQWGKKGSGPGQFLRPQSIALNAGGDIYVVDAGNARVEELSPTGKFLRSWGSTGVNDGQFEAAAGIAVDGAGNVFVSDNTGQFIGGSLYLFGRIQKFSPTGKWISSWTDFGNNVFLNFPGGMAFDPQGNLVVADSQNNRIVRISPSGQALQTFGSQGANTGQFQTPTDVAVDGQGNVYVADEQNSRIQKIDPAGNATAWGTYGAGRGQFFFPTAVAAARSGSIFVADTYNSRIQKLSEQTGKVQAVWGKFATIPNVLGTPGGIAVDPNGNVWITDRINDRIQERSPNGNVLAVVGHHGNQLAEKNTQGLGQFFSPQGIAIEPVGKERGKIYVADTLNCRIQLLAPRGPIGSIGTFGHIAGQFVGPYTVAVDHQGNIYVGDTGNQRVQKLSPAGKVIWTVGAIGTGPGQFELVDGIAVDSQGNVYVSDYLNSRIQKFSSDGKLLGVWGKLDPLGNARFDGPGGLAVDSHDNIYVADSSHNAVEKLSSDGALLQVFAIPGAASNPNAVAVDAHGTIYVTDDHNSDIVKLAPTGEVIAIWS